jgi:hypothetical protein
MNSMLSFLLEGNAGAQSEAKGTECRESEQAQASPKKNTRWVCKKGFKIKPHFLSLISRRPRNSGQGGKPTEWNDTYACRRQQTQTYSFNDWWTLILLLFFNNKIFLKRHGFKNIFCKEKKLIYLLNEFTYFLLRSERTLPVTFVRRKIFSYINIYINIYVCSNR